MSLSGFLRAMQGDKIVEVIPLRDDSVTIGRDKGAILVDDEEVSAQHCQIKKIDGNYHIFDLNSTNGSFLNGQRIIKGSLHEGDEIKIGSTRFIFFLDEDVHAKRPAPTFDPVTLDEPTDPAARAIDSLLQSERSALLSSLQMVIEVIYADGSQGTLNLREREFVIGRATVLGQFSQDEELSRRHGRIWIDDEGIAWVEDLNSTNGVFVNKKEITARTRVGPEDIIQLGRCRVKVDVSSSLIPQF